MYQVHLSNHIDDEIDPSKCVRTEVTLVKDEFFEFNVALCTQVTFCLKELRAILTFAESLKLDLDCRMEGAGQYDKFMFLLRRSPMIFIWNFFFLGLCCSVYKRIICIQQIFFFQR